MKTKTAFSMLALACAFVCAATVIAVPETSFAQRAARAQIFLTQTAIPANLSERALLGFARSHSARRLTETDGVPFRDRTWNGSLVINFASAPGDLEFHVLFYDISGGARRFIDDMTTYLNDRNQRTYVQRLRLPRSRFRANRRYELVVTLRREEVGKTEVELAGAVEDRSGVVDFSSEPTRPAAE